nr:MAG TPA: hypothetical protein [Caudoviricetes sp.]
MRDVNSAEGSKPFPPKPKSRPVRRRAGPAGRCDAAP